MPMWESDLPDDGPEALEWLGRTPSPGGVVWEEYLHEPAEMAGLVRELYAMGSPRVFVPAAFIRPRCLLPHGERPEESFGLSVHLPPSVEARWAVLDFCAERAGRAGQMPPSSARRYAESGGTVLLAYVS